LHDNNELKEFFSKEDNISISSGNNNESKTINVSVIPKKTFKKKKL
jgi:hypothetical protein